MVKDYFQDIVPPDGASRSVRTSAPVRTQRPTVVQQPEEQSVADVPGAAGRSIRDIAPSTTRARLSGEREGAVPVSQKSSRKTNWLVWGIAFVAVICVCVLGLFAFRKSSVLVTPRSQLITFDPTIALFSAVPEASAATGTLPYTVFTSDIEDSEPVAAQGLKYTESKASGKITVYNDYSASSVRLIKNTRFESASGLIFRTPADVVVPGKKGSTPGSISITVEADQPGDEYNIAPGQFTVPGLKNNAVMFKGVYAVSNTQFDGGFKGDQPQVDQATLSAAVSAVRSRLAGQAQELADTHEGYLSFPDLVRITYRSLPSTTEAGGGVRIRERAHVETIAIPRDVFTRVVASTAAADAEQADITLIPLGGFGARLLSAPESWGTSPVEFALSGAAQFVWDVDASALAEALAGKDQSAFSAIITGFPGVQEAHARIQPFWKNSFPTDPADIQIDIKSPDAAQ